MIGYIFTSTVLAFLGALSFLIFVRVLFPFFFSEESPIFAFLYASTEPVMLPVRNALSRSDFFSSLPVDLSAVICMLIIFIARLVLSIV